VWGSPDDPLVQEGAIPHIVSLLRSLGYRARAHIVGSNYFDTHPRVFRKIQMTPPSWGDATPNGFFSTWFLCSAAFNHHWFCSTHLDREIRDAETLETTNPTAATSAWTHIDREITYQAAWVPVVNPTSFDFTSARVRNYQSTPGGVLADQFWLR
jgi:ABC-type transport system substrate-binding protein